MKGTHTHTHIQPHRNWATYYELWACMEKCAHAQIPTQKQWDLRRSGRHTHTKGTMADSGATCSRSHSTAPPYATHLITVHLASPSANTQAPSCSWARVCSLHRATGWSLMTPSLMGKVSHESFAAATTGKTTAPTDTCAHRQAKLCPHIFCVFLPVSVTPKSTKQEKHSATTGLTNSLVCILGRHAGWCC